VDGVVAASQLVADLDQLHAGDAQAAPLQARDDFTDQAALDSIGLDNYEGAFHVVLLVGVLVGCK